MNGWARAGILGSVLYYLPRKNTAFAERKRDGAAVGSQWHEYELKLVQVIYRHGARTPLKPIPHKEQVEWSPALLKTPEYTQFDYRVTDLVGGPKPHSPFEERYRSRTLKGGTFSGQLTTVGMDQMFKLGTRLRKHYIEEQAFLSDRFKSAEVFVRSTNIVRNMESTRCLLAGLYKQHQEGPVTIVTADANNEILYPNYQGCQLLKHLISDKMLNATSQPGMKEDLKKIRKELKIHRDEEADFFLLLDNLLAQEAHGFPCSSRDKPFLMRSEERAIDIVSHTMGCHDGQKKTFGKQNFTMTLRGAAEITKLWKKHLKRDILKLSVGPFLHALQSNLLDRVESTATDAQSRKLYLYAAHDVTIMPLLVALGIFDKRWPPYAADLTLELYQHQESKEWFARLIYNGEEQILKGCEAGLCPLKDFLTVFSKYSISPEEYTKLCCVNEIPNANKAQK